MWLFSHSFFCSFGTYSDWCSPSFLNLWFDVNNFGKFYTMNTSNISFVLFSLFLPLIFQLHIIDSLWYCIIFFMSYSVCLFFFLFAFKFEKYPLSIDKPLVGFFFFTSNSFFFISSIYFWFLAFPPLCLLYPPTSILSYCQFFFHKTHWNIFFKYLDI